MTPEQQQQKMGQAYADYLVAYAAARAQNKALGTFIEWQHANNRIGIKVPKRGEEPLRGQTST